MRIGVTWYTEETWAQVKDQAIFFAAPPDFYGFQFVGKDEAITGIVAERVFINASELLAWCLAQRKQNDAAARSEYVSQFLMKNRQGAS